MPPLIQKTSLQAFKIFTLVFLCGFKALSTSDWLSYFSFLLVTDGAHVFFCAAEQSTAVSTYHCLGPIQRKAMQAWGKEEKGRKQGTETRLTLSRTNTIATNLDQQNSFKLTKKKNINNELTAVCF